MSELYERIPDIPVRVRRSGEVRTSIRILAVVVIGLILGIKLLNYMVPGATSVAGVESAISHARARVRAYIRDNPYLHHCGAGQSKLIVSGGWVCAEAHASPTVYDRIYETYPAGPNGKNYVYTSTTTGSKSVADDLLRGVVDMPRYAPVHVGLHPTWRENPFDAVYWRLNYYSLRPTQSLLAAYIQTGDDTYARRLIALDESFFAHDRSPAARAWQDDHAVSFRTMILINDWWRLRQYHQLTETDSALYLRELERTGQFLADRNHYQPEYNHGTNEAAALFDLALNFPTLPHAHTWLALARQRLSQSMDDLVDGDGALIENSPYYHFYTLDKYWQILAFADRFHYTIAPNFRARLRQMITYATYILQPDSSVPLLGASLTSVIHAHGSFAQMAEANPYFQYVLTHGEKGKVPPRTSVLFPHTGQTILRSGWGRGSTFEHQSFLTFNVGSYRTPHSHLDILGITLFGAGTQLLSDAGLYTYNPGRMHAYFRGTSAHNTVVVDGKNQAQGAAAEGRFVDTDGIAYQTGTSQLYEGVTHRRLVMMIDRTHFLVVDRLSSTARHRYDQMFHLAPGAIVRRRGLTITGEYPEAKTSITLQQLDPRGLSASVVSGRLHPTILGLCSLTYQKAVPCPAISYESRGVDARFTTLLTIGPPDPAFHISYARDGSGRLSIRDHARQLTIRLSESSATATVATATHPNPPKVKGLAPLPNSEVSADSTNWRDGGGAPVRPLRIDGRLALPLVATGVTPAVLEDDAVRADLSKRNLWIEVRDTNIKDLGELEIQLSNDHWRTTMTDSLEDGYPSRYAGEWLNLSLGRALSRRSSSRWSVSGAGPFDWSRIDGVRVQIEATRGAARMPSFALGGVMSIPQQPEGVVSFVFDDGYSSILPAAAYMHRMGLPGNVAVIGKYVELPTNTHLTRHDLLHLQNDWGWNMANHTQAHVDAVVTYWPERRLGAYEEDIIGGALFLEKAGLNSAPNWLIYPHGSTNAGLDKVVRRFYRFARTTDYQPEAFPFGNPLRVKTLEISSPTDSEAGGAGVTTSPAEVLQAVADAKRFHTTLILTFHRIHALRSDRPGYPISLFRAIVNGVVRSHIAVTTLSGLDRLMGVPENNRIVVHPGIASQIDVRVSVKVRHGGVLAWLKGVL